MKTYCNYYKFFESWIYGRGLFPIKARGLTLDQNRISKGHYQLIKELDS